MCDGRGPGVRVWGGEVGEGCEGEGVKVRWGTQVC